LKLKELMVGSIGEIIVQEEVVVDEEEDIEEKNNGLGTFMTQPN